MAGVGGQTCFHIPKSLGTQLLHAVSFVLGDYLRHLLQETLQHNISGGIKLM